LLAWIFILIYDVNTIGNELPVVANPIANIIAFGVYGAMGRLFVGSFWCHPKKRCQDEQ
jgi:hypothetical protein